MRTGECQQCCRGSQHCAAVSPPPPRPPHGVEGSPILQGPQDRPCMRAMQGPVLASGGLCQSRSSRGFNSPPTNAVPMPQARLPRLPPAAAVRSSLSGRAPWVWTRSWARLTWSCLPGTAWPTTAMKRSTFWTAAASATVGAALKLQLSARGRLSAQVHAQASHSTTPQWHHQRRTTHPPSPILPPLHTPACLPAPPPAPPAPPACPEPEGGWPRVPREPRPPRPPPGHRRCR